MEDHCGVFSAVEPLAFLFQTVSVLAVRVSCKLWCIINLFDGSVITCSGTRLHGQFPLCASIGQLYENIPKTRCMCDAEEFQVCCCNCCSRQLYISWPTLVGVPCECKRHVYHIYMTRHAHLGIATSTYLHERCPCNSLHARR